MEPLKENGTINLRRTVIKQPATRIIGKTVNPHLNGGFSATNSLRREQTLVTGNSHAARQVGPSNLTNNNFSVTRARVHAHAYAHARANANTRVIPDSDGLRRVLNAALSGGDVKVASIKPMSFSARLIAILLLPAMLIMPLVPAYADEAPLAERVAGDVASMIASSEVENTNTQIASLPDNTGEEVAAGESSATPNVENDTTQDVIDSVEGSELPTANVDVAPSTNQDGGQVAGATDASAPSPSEPSNTETTSSDQSTSSSNENAAPSEEVNNSDSSISTGDSTQVKEDVVAEVGAGESNITPPYQESSSTEVVIPEPEQTEEGTPETQVLDIPSVEVQEDLDAIRARLRDEIRNEVKMELRSEVEREVYRGCKNLDGVGYYCIPDAKSFGPAVVENERSISVVVEADKAEGDKEIFLSRNSVALQLTHNSDDDVFPVLDPASDLLVWQSLVEGHWQIAYANVNDIGVPKVNYLTSGENNFNPKVYRGRIVWQAWVEGNWEIFSATKAFEKLPDEALTAEHRAAGVDGNWNIKRITANNSPDMFPSVTSDSVTWQAIDDGVWQVFSYDLVSGESKRISKKGVKSESPRSALIWSEEDETGQLRLVGSDVNNLETIDFTALARRLVDKSKSEPDSPISNTEIIVEAPISVRAEEEAPVS